MYIRQIQLTNVRAFSSLTIPQNGNALPKRVVIIGGNSTCKTTILRCIAIGLCNKTHASALLSELPGSLVGPRKDTATIKIDLASGRQPPITSITTTIRRRDLKRRDIHRPPKGRRPAKMVEDEILEQKVFQDNSEIADFDRSNLFVCGYGAGRGLSGTESATRYRIIDSVYTLFRYDQPLQNPELSLYRLHNFHPQIEQNTKKRLLQLLGLSPAHKIELTPLGVMVSGPTIGRAIPLDAVADGYRTTFTWLSDLVCWAMLSGSIDPRTGQIQGIALIDEIEQHLHPTIQIALLRRLKNVFPDLQIIATSHSPITALYAEDDGLYALKRYKDSVRLLPDVKHLSYLSFEDVLADDRLFDTDPEGPLLREVMRKYRHIAKIPRSRRSPAQSRRLAELSAEIRTARSQVPMTSPILQGLRKLRRDLGL